MCQGTISGLHLWFKARIQDAGRLMMKQETSRLIARMTPDAISILSFVPTLYSTGPIVGDRMEEASKKGGRRARGK